MAMHDEALSHSIVGGRALNLQCMHDGASACEHVHVPGAQLDLAAQQVLGGPNQEGGLDLAAFAQLLLPQPPPSLSLFEARVKPARHTSPAAAAAEDRRPQMCACCVC
jgi:hypothetical protein